MSRAQLAYISNFGRPVGFEKIEQVAGSGSERIIAWCLAEGNSTPPPGPGIPGSDQTAGDVQETAGLRWMPSWASKSRLQEPPIVPRPPAGRDESVGQSGHQGSALVQRPTIRRGAGLGVELPARPCPGDDADDPAAALANRPAISYIRPTSAAAVDETQAATEWNLPPQVSAAEAKAGSGPGLEPQKTDTFFISIHRQGGLPLQTTSQTWIVLVNARRLRRRGDEDFIPVSRQDWSDSHAFQPEHAQYGHVVSRPEKGS